MDITLAVPKIKAHFIFRYVFLRSEYGDTITDILFIHKSIHLAAHFIQITAVMFLIYVPILVDLYRLKRYNTKKLAIFKGKMQE